jgi:glycosyltransferase involved in cell wall biosynthesis
MKIVVICRMSDDKVKARLKPLVCIDEVEEIFLIRRYPIDIPKVRNFATPKWTHKILLISELYRFFALLFVCLTQQPDVIYGIYFVPHGLYASLAGKLFRKTVIQELIGTDRPKVMRSKLLLYFLKSADHIFVRGNTSKEQLINSGVLKDKIIISKAANVLDFDHFKPDGSRKVYDFNYSGRMDKNKQLDVLIRSVSALVSSHPAITMVFVGDGPERKNLEDLTTELGLEQNISFVGNQTYARIPYYLNRSKVFVMSSAFEGLPVAMLEALSCGLPVVVPRIGDIIDLAVHQVNALLVNQTTTEAYVEVMDKILGDENCYCQLIEGALDTRQRLMTSFTLDRASADFKRIFNHIE